MGKQGFALLVAERHFSWKKSMHESVDDSDANDAMVRVDSSSSPHVTRSAVQLLPIHFDCGLGRWARLPKDKAAGA